ncbi:MAG TPA: hypothetical protein VMR18_00235 [Candidatus Saccharimonadales bacterium]|jgi:hypothetical protein|nr:hypothetical protein [Candidatus Saccharimonadales bacterium]
MSPTSTTPVINPGSVYNSSFQVIDQGNTTYNFQIYSSPYHVTGEDYAPDFTPIANAPNPAGWFKFSIGSSSISPTQSMKVDYSITVPKTTLPGAYFAVAFAQTQYPKIPNTITLNERVGEIFYIQVAGPVTQGGKLLTWQSNPFQEPPLTSTIRIEDSGGLNFPATIQVSVKDVFGQSKYSLSTVKEVLPQTIRRITIPWDKSPSIGIFKVSGTINFLGHEHKLPTKWVLVMSHTVRMYLLIVVVVLVLLIIMRFIYRTTRRSKKPKSKKK